MHMFFVCGQRPFNHTGQPLEDEPMTCVHKVVIKHGVTLILSNAHLRCMSWVHISEVKATIGEDPLRTAIFTRTHIFFYSGITALIIYSGIVRSEVNPN